MINLVMGPMFSEKTKSIPEGVAIFTCKPNQDWGKVLNFLANDGNHVDEAQFIDWTENKADLIAEFYLNDSPESIWFYGLDKWHNTSETSLSKYMKYRADSVRYLRARCDGCGEPATFTAKISGDRSEQVNEDKALYSPRCEACYDVLCKKQAEVEERSFANGYGY